MLRKNNKNYFFKDIDSNVVAAFSRRCDGNMSLNYGDTSKSLENRKIFLQNLGIDYHDLVCAKQIHKSNIGYAEEKDRGKGAIIYGDALDDTDALITNKKNVPLAVFSADCLSVFIFDPKTPALGLIHAGWQGSKENITYKTVKLMQEKFNLKPEELYVAFGPAIRDCCYVVGEEFRGYFPKDLIKRNSRYYLDLVGINKRQLLDLRIKQENIFDAGICTHCQSKEFFSYRKEGSSCGRIMSVAIFQPIRLIFS